MTQIDPHSPKTTTRSPEVGEPPRKQEPPFNWRVSVGMAIGLLVLFAVLFGLRALEIFPPKPAEDPQIAAARATLAAAPTQQAAPAAEPTSAPTQVSAQAPSGPSGVSTAAATGAAPALATVASAPTTAATLATAQQPAAKTQVPSAPGTQFETAPTPVAASTSAQAVPTVSAANTVSSTTQTSPTATGDSPSGQPTPVAINLPADLANAILQGYTNYWSVRVNAMRDPADGSIDLGSVMAGDELVGAQKTIDQYRQAHQAFESDVKHTIWITSANADKAVVVDQFTATTLPVDPDTKAPLDANASVENRTDTFELQHLDGAWKVVDEP